MKIALVRARYNPFGGAERFAARAMAALIADRAGAPEIAVIARSWRSETRADAAVRLIRCDPFHIGSVWRDASFARGVHRVLADEPFDLVQSHERIVGLPIYRAGDGVHASWLERRGRAGGLSTRLGISLSLHHRYLRSVERAMFEHRALRAVICNSEMVRGEIATRFAIAPERLVLIRNGVDLARFHPDSQSAHRSPMRRRLTIDDDAFVFVLVGSGFERKGVAQALAALVDCPAATLVIVGDDKRRARYRRLAAGVASRTRFVGAVEDPLPYYAMADAFVLPTLYDPFPNAALEALACGLPVVTTDACGAAELIDDGVNGTVVAADDPAALAVAMRGWTARDTTQRAAAARAARASAEPYSLDVLSRALRDLYATLLEHPVATETPVLNSPALWQARARLPTNRSD